MNKQKYGVIILFLGIFFGGVWLYAMSEKPSADTPKKRVDIESDSQALAQSKLQVLDRGALLPALNTSQGRELIESLSHQHQVWVIDTLEMQESVARLFSFPFPTIDFNTHQLVFIFQGVKSTGGYTLHVKKMDETATQIRLWVMMEEPGESCMTSQSITAPFELIRLPKSDKKVVVLPQKKVVECE